MESDRAKRMLLPENTLVGMYHIVKHIGRGGFGDVYLVIHIETKKRYAMKTEYLTSKKQAMEHEVEILRNIKASGFPRVYDYGKEETFRYFVMDLYSKSLSQLRRDQTEKKFPLFFVIPIAEETLRILEGFHKLGYIHRDIKPSNFLTRRRKYSHPICLIDFGFAKFHINPKTGHPYPQTNELRFTGTKKYASINAHLGKNLARCDDLISWFYMIAELSTGKLPWNSSLERDDVMKQKIASTPSDVCRGLPSQFISIYKYLLTLKYEDEPDYEYIRAKIRDAADLVQTSNSIQVWRSFEELICDGEEDEEEDDSMSISGPDTPCSIA